MTTEICVVIWGKEISIGFVAAFGNEIERIVGDVFSEKANLYSIGN